MMIIDKLKVELKITEDRRIYLRDALDEARNKAEIPAMKKKYEGKCFKYQNSYGGDADERWWMYVKVLKVTSKDTLKVLSFQTKPRNQYEFEVDERSHTYLCQKEITKKEYKDALSDFKKAINKL